MVLIILGTQKVAVFSLHLGSLDSNVVTVRDSEKENWQG